MYSSKVLLIGFLQYLRLCVSGKHALGGLHDIALLSAFRLAWCPGHLYRQSKEHYDFEVIVQRVYALTRVPCRFGRPNSVAAEHSAGVAHERQLCHYLCGVEV